MEFKTDKEIYENAKNRKVLMDYLKMPAYDKIGFVITFVNTMIFLLCLIIAPTIDGTLMTTLFCAIFLISMVGMIVGFFVGVVLYKRKSKKILKIKMK